MSLCFLIIPHFLSAQSESKLIAGSGNKNVFIPPGNYTTPNSASTRSATFHVNYIDDSANPWPGEAKEAFDRAAILWGEIIQSEVDIHITVQYVNIPGFPLAPPPLAIALIPQPYFNFMGIDDAYLSETAYPPSLAEKLAQMELSNAADMTITVNSHYEDNFYFGIDGAVPSDKYDFLTVALHEIGHGLGFHSGTNVDSNGNGYYGWEAATDVIPWIYERFIFKPHPQISNYIALTSLTSGTSEVEDFLTHQLRWVSLSAANEARLHTPSDFNEGSSIIHLHEDQTTQENQLMTPTLDKGEAIHDPGPISVAILNDIGWEASLPTGTLDQLTIQGFDYEEFTYGQFPQPPFITTPSTDLNIDESYYYQFQISNNITPNWSTAVWKIEAIHKNGKYLIEECGQGCISAWWELNIDDLPSGYDWARNLQGQVKAEITMVTQDMSGLYYSGLLEVGINYKPAQPYIASTQDISKNCSSQSLTFYAQGATSYKIMYNPAPIIQMD